MRRIVDDPQAGVARFVAELEDLVSQQQHHVLVPGRDETLFAVSTHRERLSPYVAMGLPEHAVVERAQNKARLAIEAAKVGLASPDGVVCDDVDAALEAARAFGFPVVVKPVHTIVEVDGKLLRYPSRLVSDEPSLRAAQIELGRCIVQRREVGRVLSLGGVATEQGLLGCVVARYLRTWPPVVGYACFSETIAPPGDLVERVQALVDAIGWRGPFELEMIERHDGVIQAIDFNPRLYGSIWLATASRVPLTSLWCAWLLGDRPAPARARVGVRFRYEEGDAHHLVWQLRQRDYRGAAKTLAPRRGVAHAYFQVRDPMPAITHSALIAAGVGRRVWQRAGR